MNAVALSSMQPVLPEIVLAVGAMALLMLGAYRERATTPLVSLCCRSLLLVAAAVIVAADPERARSSARSFIVDDFARFMKILAYAGSAFAIVMSLDYLADETAADLRISDPDPALDHRHGDADLGRRPDRALSRPRADEPRALRRRGIEPRQRALDRGRPEVFRARRAVVRHAALRLLADLRLHRQRVVRRHRQGLGRRAASG